MEWYPTQPINIEIQNEHHLDHLCSTEEDAVLSLKLEEFWDAEKHRVQLVESQVLSSSLENQFLYEDSVSKPISDTLDFAQKVPTHISDVETGLTLRGEDIHDIPTVYTISGLRNYEFPVVGTYVDRRIVPGFKYRVRIIQTDLYQFGGKALNLRSIGMGYGKRLTFESESLNYNENYFWSDSDSNGYGFAIVAIEEGDEFIIKDYKDAICGELTVRKCSNSQTEKDMRVAKDGVVEKTIEVRLWAEIRNAQNELDIRLSTSQDDGFIGKVSLVRSKQTPVAEVRRVDFDDCSLKGYHLEARAKMKNVNGG
ncbi:uncharacterized protein LOC106470010 [Limulus polyphemus]|uniref:Uncharacterized protein LOC106470010 n=1 Tax=Limulus polyphemus TaxID=6850 RepID=A0ABM1BP78_LIMPO|nr:uncharacterized protein LOC106470010 [Limulus polyphemus]